MLFQTKTTKGYDVSAPIGLSYCCTKSPGMFAPDLGDEANRDRKFLAGLTFPEIRLQVAEAEKQQKCLSCTQLFFPPFPSPRPIPKVFEVYTLEPGNRWTCGSFIGIGLWVGILVSLFFALVCYWGFTMLASIHTMDRWAMAGLFSVFPSTYSWVPRYLIMEKKNHITRLFRLLIKQNSDNPWYFLDFYPCSKTREK